jgi:hypothetical protein
LKPARLVLLGAALTAVGIVIAGTAPVIGTARADWTASRQVLGGAVTLCGWIALGWGIHSFGRQKDDRP